MTRGITVVRDPGALSKFSGRTAVTLGNFDGVHLGHQVVLKRLVAAARAAEIREGVPARSVVISFYPHPSVVLGRAKDLSCLTTVRQKAALLEALGVSALVLLHFTKKLAALSAPEFLESYFLRSLRATEAVLGPDTALGRNREGDRAFVESYLGGRGVRAETVQFLDGAGSRISSRRIRELLLQGDVPAANALLGHAYALEGRVLKGAARGRTIGAPTANTLPRSQVVPKFGVYASKVTLPGGAQHGAVTNIGVRPTFGGGKPGIETHIFGYTGDLYGARIEVALVQRLRDEQRFSGVAELKAQIMKDIAAAKKLVQS